MSANGAIVAYAIWKLQERGRMFVSPGDPVYEGMIIGIHSRDNDLVVNPIKTKQLTNIRASGKDEAVIDTNTQFAPNFRAFDIGRTYAEANIPAIGLKVRRSDKVGDRIFVEGNDAAGLGAGLLVLAGGGGPLRGGTVRYISVHRAAGDDCAGASGPFGRSAARLDPP